MSLVRVLALCLAAAFAVQTSGVLEALESPPCCKDAGCPEENDQGHCPPSCSLCVAKVFAQRAPLLAEPAASSPLPQPRWPTLDHAADGVDDDVFHPPRA